MDLDPGRDCRAPSFNSSPTALPAQGAKQLNSTSEGGYLCARDTSSTNRFPERPPCKQDVPRDVCCRPIGNCRQRTYVVRAQHPPPQATQDPRPTTATTATTHPPLPMLSQTMRINLCKYRRLIKWLRWVPLLFRPLSVVLKARQRESLKRLSNEGGTSGPLITTLLIMWRCGSVQRSCGRWCFADIQHSDGGNLDPISLAEAPTRSPHAQ